jgi:hypothetical protein
LKVFGKISFLYTFNFFQVCSSSWQNQYFYLFFWCLQQSYFYYDLINFNQCLYNQNFSMIPLHFNFLHILHRYLFLHLKNYLYYVFLNNFVSWIWFFISSNQLKQFKFCIHNVLFHYKIIQLNFFMGYFRL